MNTSAIPASALISAGANSKPQQSEGSTPDVPFNQILNREVADRNATENSNAPKTREVSNTSKPAETSDRTSSSPSEDSKSTESSGSNDTAANISATAEQLLMMAAQFAPVAPPATATPVTPPADPYTQSLVAELSNKPPVDLTPQTSNAELKTVETSPILVADTAAKNTAAFNTALNQAIDNKQMQDTGDMSANKPLLEETSSSTTQFAAKTAETIPLTTSSQPTINSGDEKIKDARPDLSAAIAPLQNTIANSTQLNSVHSSDRILPSVGTPGWNQAIGQKVTWMIGNEQQSASLSLNPPDLGPLQVVLSVSSTHANASFYSAQPEVRQALEAALPKLREMLADAGIQLGQANVSAGNPQQQNSYNQTQTSSHSMNQRTETASSFTSTVSTSNVRIIKEGMIDTFA